MIFFMQILWLFYDFFNEKFMIFLCFFYDFFEGGAGRKNHKNIIKWVIKKS